MLFSTLVVLTAVAISSGSPMGLEVGVQASAGRGFSPPIGIVLYGLNRVYDQTIGMHQWNYVAFHLNGLS